MSTNKVILVKHIYLYQDCPCQDIQSQMSQFRHFVQVNRPRLAEENETEQRVRKYSDSRFPESWKLGADGGEGGGWRWGNLLLQNCWLRLYKGMVVRLHHLWLRHFVNTRVVESRGWSKYWVEMAATYTTVLPAEVRNFSSSYYLFFDRRARLHGRTTHTFTEKNPPIS